MAPRTFILLKILEQLKYTKSSLDCKGFQEAQKRLEPNGQTLISGKATKVQKHLGVRYKSCKLMLL